MTVASQASDTFKHQCWKLIDVNVLFLSLKMEKSVFQYSQVVMKEILAYAKLTGVI